MSTPQNSIYAPTPFSVANGGTGNSTTLATNAVWLGNGTATPTPTTLIAGTDVTFTPGSGTLTIASTAADPSAVIVPNGTTSVNPVVGNTTYMPTNSTGIVATTFTLPVSPTPGNFYQIIGTGPNKWQILQNSGQQISVGGVTTTVGTGGSITSAGLYECMIIYCQTTTSFTGVVLQGQVNIT